MKRVKTIFRVYLNENAPLSFLYGYRAGDPLRLVVDQTLLLPSTAEEAEREMRDLLDLAFRELNVDDPRTSWAAQYRRQRNRSLSVGDVVMIGELAWACAPVGWTQLSLLDASLS